MTKTDCCEAMRKAVETLQKHGIDLSAIKSSVCATCHGSGEYGLADGDIPCPKCYGSGDPLKPGVFKKSEKHP